MISANTFFPDLTGDLTGEVDVDEAEVEVERPKLAEKYPFPEVCKHEHFLIDVANHSMSIINDDGVNRHLRFQKRGTGIDYFDIITWQNRLVFTGDRGTFVFTRLKDMAAFFRLEQFQRNPVRIDFRYWAEKCIAADRCGIREYDHDVFRAHLAEWFDENFDQYSDPDALQAAIEHDLMPCGADFEHEAIEAAREFEFDGKQPLSGWWEVSQKRYTYGFIWCCYAIAWSIDQYDAAKATSSPARDRLVCDDGKCRHTAAQHFNTISGYTKCNVPDCACFWFDYDQAAWQASKPAGDVAPQIDHANN